MPPVSTPSLTENLNQRALGLGRQDCLNCRQIDVPEQVGGQHLDIVKSDAARIEAQRKGYTVRRQSLVDGSIKLVIGGV